MFATFPDKYLGIQLMPGACKYIHIRQVVEKIQDKLARWKGRALSFQDRAVYLRSVIASFPIYTMSIYRWPLKIIKQCETAMMNFLWTGDSKKRKALVVAYDRVCSPYEEGGLGLNRLEVVNKALLMKLWWNIKTDDKKWAQFMRAKFLRMDGRLVDYKLKSTIILGIRWIYKQFEEHYRSIIGNGNSTSLYFDNWLGSNSLASMLHLSDLDRRRQEYYKPLVNSVITDGEWSFPANIRNAISDAGLLDSLANPEEGEDRKVRILEKKGVFTTHSARELLRMKFVKVPTARLIWRRCIHPSQSAALMHGHCCATKIVITKFLRIPATLDCPFCGGIEDLKHVLWDCPTAARLWSWIARIFGLTPHYKLIDSYTQAANSSGFLKDLWLSANIAICVELWKRRNKMIFEKKDTKWSEMRTRIYHIIAWNSRRITKPMLQTRDERRIIKYFGIQPRYRTPGNPTVP